MSPPPDAPLAVAVIGCGAIAESFYLPALKRLRGAAERVSLVDRDARRAESLAKRLGGGRVATDYRRVLRDVDAAILATPPDSHAPIGGACLEAGIHLLCEKPLAETAAEARRLVEAAARAGVVLGVNNTRRLFASSAYVKRQIESGSLGEIRSIRYFEGQPFAWPTASGFYFKPGAAPRGVLMDRGAHVLDLVCWWLGARPRLVASRNDSSGGPEAVAHLELEHGSCRVDIRLSWLYKQRNRFVVEGDRGRIEGDIYDWRRVRRIAADGGARTRRFASEAGVFADFGHLVSRNFLAAAAGREEILVPGSEVVDSIELIEEGYRRASRFPLPWLEPAAPTPRREETVLVTGAGGFIGGRLVEILAQSGGKRVRPALRRWSSAARIARLGVEPVLCDVTRAEQIDRALEGVEAVVHCAVGEPEVTVEGTRRLLGACLERGVRRVVFLSSVEAYGKATGEVDESTPLAPADAYGESKAAAEESCREHGARGLEVAILRPGIVYGPFSRWWTERFAERLRSGRWRLFEGFGEGPCNLVYVDDLAAAVFACLDRQQAAGEAFNVNGPDRVSWSEYVEALNRELQLPPLERSRQRWTRLKSGALEPLRGLAELAVRRCEPLILGIYERYSFTRGVIRGAELSLRTTPSAQELDLYRRRAYYPITKAVRLLGWEPRVGLEQGLAASRRWLVHHGFEAGV